MKSRGKDKDEAALQELGREASLLIALAWCVQWFYLASG